MNVRRWSLWLDCLMLVMVLVLEATLLTGIRLHEWLGVGLAAVVVVHLLLQWSWIASNSRRVFATGPWRPRSNAFLNLALFISMVVAIASGFMESRVLVPHDMPFPEMRRWHEIHGSSTRIMLIIAGLHLALNWDWVRILFRGLRPATMRREPLPIGAVAVRTFRRTVLVMVVVSAIVGALYAVDAALASFDKPGDQPPPIPRGAAAAPRRPLPSGVPALVAATVLFSISAVAGRKLLRLRLGE